MCWGTCGRLIQKTSSLAASRLTSCHGCPKYISLFSKTYKYLCMKQNFFLILLCPIGRKGRTCKKVLFIDHSAETSKKEKFYYCSSFKVVLMLISENILRKKGPCKKLNQKIKQGMKNQVNVTSSSLRLTCYPAMQEKADNKKSNMERDT